VIGIILVGTVGWRYSLTEFAMGIGFAMGGALGTAFERRRS
jgi:hypothetical protein